MKRYILFFVFIVLFIIISLLFVNYYLKEFTSSFYKHLILTSKVPYAPDLTTLIIFWTIIPLSFMILLFISGYKTIKSVKSNLIKINITKIDMSPFVVIVAIFVFSIILHLSFMPLRHYFYLIVFTALIYTLSFFMAIYLTFYYSFPKNKIKFTSFFQDDYFKDANKQEPLS